jgi:hypothetical protein
VKAETRLKITDPRSADARSSLFIFSGFVLGNEKGLEVLKEILAARLAMVLTCRANRLNY